MLTRNRYLETMRWRFSIDSSSEVRLAVGLAWMMLAKSGTSSGSRHPRRTYSSITSRALAEVRAGLYGRSVVRAS